jgi:hypothetical protein
MKSGKEADRYRTLTGGVEAALTTKELFLEDTNGDWVGLAPSTFLAVSTEEVRDDDTSACAAISPPFPYPSSSSSSSFFFCVCTPLPHKYDSDRLQLSPTINKKQGRE